MSYNDQVLAKYGSSSQKRQLKAKQLRYECLEESEWRKLAIKGWEALKKEAELGTRMYKPSDDMIIGILGEECFDSYKEYKDMQVKYPDYDFVHMANAMIELNDGIVNSMTKVASNAESYLDGKKMIKTAKQIGSQNREKIEDTDYEVVKTLAGGEVILKDKTNGKLELWAESDDFAGYVIEINGMGYEFVSSFKGDIEAQRVQAVMNKIAEVTDDMDVYKKALDLSYWAGQVDRVNIGVVKNFLKDKKALQSLYKIVR